MPYLLALLDTKQVCSCFLIRSTNGELQAFAVKQLDVVNQYLKGKYILKK